MGPYMAAMLGGRRLFQLVWAVGLCGAFSPRVAEAQTEGLSLDLFRPSPHAEGLFSVESARIAPSFHLRTSLWLDYATRPLVLLRSDQPGATAVVGHRLSGTLAVSLTLLDRFSLSLSLPGTFVQAGDSSPLDDVIGRLELAGLGDLSVGAKVALLNEENHGVGLAFAGQLALPTGTRRAYTTNASVSGSIAVLVERRLGAFRLAANAGVQLRPEATLVDWTVGHQLDLRAGAGLDLQRLGLHVPVEAILEVLNRAALNAPFANVVQTPFELDGGVKVRAASWLEINAGMGGRLSSGAGAPAFRVFAGLAIIPCVAKPPVKEEPVSLPASIAVVEAASLPASIPWVDPDRDQDGVVNEDDRCPDVAEDKDGFADDDGCPDPDNDQDGLSDAIDRCPNEAEVINDVDDTDGCPDEGKSLVVVTRERIEIKDKVYFDTGKANIQARSFAVLDQVAAVLRNHTDINVTIEGHTDDVGPADRNLQLSQERADAVRSYLISRSISGDRLVAVGYGETKPLSVNLSKRGRDANRRVEFVLVPTSQPQETTP